MYTIPPSVIIFPPFQISKVVPKVLVEHFSFQKVYSVVKTCDIYLQRGQYRLPTQLDFLDSVKMKIQSFFLVSSFECAIYRCFCYNLQIGFSQT